MKPSLWRRIAPLSFLLAVCGATTARAQVASSVAIAGRVTDAVTGQPVAGATVRIAGTATATTTDSGGRYALSGVPTGIFTVEAQRRGSGRAIVERVRVRANATTAIDLRLRGIPGQPDELNSAAALVATSARSAPFSVYKISVDDTPGAATGSVVEMLSGKVPGATVLRASGAPGSLAEVELRTTLRRSSATQPLYVVDGVWLDNGFPLSAQDIGPMDVESIEVLPGAIAATLYGARASSGAIVVTTGRGNTGTLGKTTFAVRNEIGRDNIGSWIQSPLTHPFRVNALGQYVDASGNVVSRENRIRQASGIREHAYTDATFDHAAQFFKPALFNAQTISLARNGAATNVSMSYARNRQPGVVTNAGGYTRQTARLNADYTYRTLFQAGVSASHTRGRDDPAFNTFQDLALFDADVDLLATNTLGAAPYVALPVPEGGRTNPLYRELLNNPDVRRSRSLGSAQVSLRPFAFLALDASASIDRGERQRTDFVPRGLPSPGGSGFTRGSIAVILDTANGARFDGGATVTKDFGKLVNVLSLRAEKQSNKRSYLDSSGSEFNADGQPLLFGKTSAGRENRTNATLGNLVLAYDGRYVADIAFRRERDPRFASGKWDTYRRASAAWILSAEPWFPGTRTDLVKLHGAIGRVNAQTEALWYATELGTDVFPPRIRNERSEAEIGLDVASSRRISASLNYATHNLTLPAGQPVQPAVSGYSGSEAPLEHLRGTTVEASAHARLLATQSGLQWDIAVAADHKSSKIVAFSGACAVQALDRHCADTPTTAMYGHTLVRSINNLAAYYGNPAAYNINDEGFVVPVGIGNTWRDGKTKNLWGTTVVINGRSFPWGLPVTQIDADGLPTSLQIGDANPRLQFGFQNTFRYKGVRLNGQFAGQLGGDTYNEVRQFLYFAGTHIDTDQSSKPDELRKPLAYFRAVAAADAFYLPNFVEDATHVRLVEASIGYDLGATNRITHRAGLSRVSIELIARNLFTLGKYSGLNPQGTSLATHVEDFGYPLTRSFSLATSIVF